MTDQRFDDYARRIEPLREQYLADLHRLESETAEAIQAAIRDLRGVVHPSPIEYVEHRLSRRLDARLRRLDEQYQLDAARIRREVGIE